jgi:hypothetical protein
MTIHGLALQEPSYNEPGDGAGGGGNIAPIGTELAGGDTNPNPQDEPLEIDENRLIRVKGSDKPVKFGDHVKGFQSQWTKASQKAAQLERELIAERAGKAELARQIQQRQQGQQGQGQNQQPDLLDALKQLPYLSGEKAAEVIRGIGQEIQQRDRVMLAMAKKFQSMEQTLGKLHGTHVNQNFESKISTWLKDGGYPDGLQNWAKELYLAYEGDDLDQEFPRIMEERWNELNKVMDAKRQAAVATARANKFVPGKGGTSGPSKPLQMDPKANPRKVADELWEAMQGSDT